MLLTSRIALENEIRGTLKAVGLKIGRDGASPPVGYLKR
jgi:hypothetical protein